MQANLLRAKIAEMNTTQGKVAAAVGISENALSRKMLGKRDFRLSEVERICKVLEIGDPIPIFFDQIVPNAQHAESNNQPRAG